jgi:DNA mismatch repair protein MutS
VKAERAPMAGIPHHAAEVYAAKLIEKGYKVKDGKDGTILEK